MEMPKFFQIMSEETPAVSKGFFDMAGAIQKEGGLDDKTFQLVYIAIKAAGGSDGLGSVVAHTVMAKQAGATREEIRGAILVSLMTNGLQGVVSCLEAALDAYDKA
ncbi:MAG: carboxymuconolactone decarboxylase family protein [Oscillospiraceae bacterium]|nr:carboxymuconolactone decarboxylase family protein [Oscillospiraceae bacterium]